MIISKEILDDLTWRAQESTRLRMNMDLRNSVEDSSQRLLNAIDPGTILPIHRHLDSSVTIVCIRGHFEEYLYDDSGKLVETIDMLPGGNVINLPKGQWHSLNSLESGMVLLEAQDGRWEPLKGEDLLSGLSVK